ncbi:hypothetical protein MMC14_010744 [Varicellaria rhodocarpa]|nr:hypothetical protein [Varicellaria rhodocarpa]
MNQFNLFTSNPPPNKRVKTEPLQELEPNVQYNRLEDESIEAREARRQAVAKGKNQRVRQRARARGDVPTPTPPLQNEQPEPQHE